MESRVAVRAIVAAFGALAPVRPAAGQRVADAGAFVLRIGGDTLVIERFTRAADTITGSLSVKGQPRQDYVAAIGPDHTIASIALTVYPAGAPAGAAPLQRANVEARRDSMIADLGGQTQRFATRPDAIMVMNNSFALAEEFTRRARAAGGPADIPGWALSGGVTLSVALAPIGSDSMTLTIAGQVERLRVDRDGRILGGTIPSQRLAIDRVGPAVAAGLTMGRVDYSAPPEAPYTATDVTVREPGGITLGGTLTLPKGVIQPVPAAVTITGSGQEDRDEYIPLAGNYRPFRQIADTLGRRGIAVLRLDDRMVGASGGPLGTSADYAQDIEAALAYLRTRPEIDSNRLALIGHSEGGMIAPMVAVADPRVTAIVLLAGPAKTGREIIRYQQRQAIDHDSAIAPAGRDSAYRAATVELDSAAAHNRWLKFFLSYDPLATARRVRAPALILQGATDHQVTPDQAEQLAAAMRAGGDPDVTVRIFPELDHLFIPDPSGLPSGYTHLGSDKMSTAVLGAIADWLAKHLNAE
ncbi:MAG: alpha/beta hydrolase family protein [Gemmatimonadales bacterium]